MNGLNRATVLGTLGHDPELRNTAKGTPVTTLRLATNRRVKAAEGEAYARETDWHRVVVFGRQAEACSRFLAKGSKVYVEGRMQTRTYTDKEGRVHDQTEIVAEEVQWMAAGRPGEDSPGHGEPGRRSSAEGNGAYGHARGGGDEDAADLPF